MYAPKLLARSLLLLLHLTKIWMWVIPKHLTIIAVAGYFGLMYLLFGTIHVAQIKIGFGDNKWGYFFGFILPLALPMLIAFFSMFSQGASSSDNSLQRAIQFRNCQMRVKPPAEASNILKKTSLLDLIENSDSDVMLKAQRGFESQYGNSPPTRVFKDLMDEGTKNLPF